MPIGTRVDIENQLTVHTVQGTVTYDESIKTIKKFYSNNPTTHVIWNLKDGTFNGFSSAQIRSIADIVTVLSKNRRSGKTAGIVSKDVDFGICRMFQSLVEVKGYKPEVQLFYNEPEAMDWLHG